LGELEREGLWALDAGCKFLIFDRAGVRLAVELWKVREIANFVGVRPFADISGPMLGMYSLRGTYVPIINLRRALRLSTAPSLVPACVLVMQASARQGQRLVGIPADTVWAIEEVATKHETAGPLDRSFKRSLFTRGALTFKEGEATVLDVDRLSAACLPGRPWLPAPVSTAPLAQAPRDVLPG